MLASIKLAIIMDTNWKPLFYSEIEDTHSKNATNNN
jgi:hypothetical protein